ALTRSAPANTQDKSPATSFRRENDGSNLQGWEGEVGGVENRLAAKASINSGQQPGRPSLVGGGFREGLGQDRLLVVPAAQVEGDGQQEDKRGRRREKLNR